MCTWERHETKNEKEEREITVKAETQTLELKQMK